MIAFAVVVSALLQVGLIAMLVWRDVSHERREDRLINLLAAKSAGDFAVMQRADGRPVQKAKADPADEGSPAYKPQPVGLG